MAMDYNMEVIEVKNVEKVDTNLEVEKVKKVKLSPKMEEIEAFWMKVDPDLDILPGDVFTVKRTKKQERLDKEDDN